MINRIVVCAGYGLTDWIAQRATAVIMAVYSVLMAAVLLVVRPGTFEAWQSLEPIWRDIAAKVDPDTGKVVRQVPDETLLKLRVYARELREAGGPEPADSGRRAGRVA